MAMRLRADGSPFQAVAAALALLASACFDGGDYGGGGRRLEAPGLVDVAEDASVDATTEKDASSEEVDASEGEEGAVLDAPLDLPPSEPMSDVEDAERDEAEAAPLDVAQVDVRADAPPSSPDVTEPRDAFVDVAMRDMTVDVRRD
jgi:hypothetical protein